MKPQAYALFRCMLEPIFPLVAISKFPDFANLLIESNEFEKHKSSKKIISFHERNNPDSIELNKAKQLSENLKLKVTSKKFKKVSVYDTAKKAGLEDWYDTFYSHASSYLHASITALEERLVLDETAENITALKNEPDCEKFDQLYSMLIECFVCALQATCNVFHIEEPTIITTTVRTLKALNTEKA